MMEDSDLKDYIDFSKKLLYNVQNSQNKNWFNTLFKKEIINRFFKNQNENNQFDKFNSLTENDVLRIKAYLNFIDRKAQTKGKIFYDNISNEKLKIELIKDFKEMQIVLKNDDVKEFGRFVFMQIENMFNFSLKDLNVYKKIDSNKEYYMSVKPKWWNYDPINFYDSFFYYDKKIMDYKEKNITYVPFKTKSLFLCYYFDFKINPYILSKVTSLRNMSSHRIIDDETNSELQKIVSSFDEDYSDYYKLLETIRVNITNINLH